MDVAIATAYWFRGWLEPSISLGFVSEHNNRRNMTLRRAVYPRLDSLGRCSYIDAQSGELDAFGE